LVKRACLEDKQAYLCGMQPTNNQTVPVAEHQQVLAENADLKSRIAWFERQMFGVKSERYVPINTDQLSLFDALEAKEAQADKEIAAHKRKAPEDKSKHQGRMAIPASLPRVDEIIEPEEDTTDMKRIGEDMTEVLEYTPVRLWVRRTIRPRYARTEAQQAQVEAKAEELGQKPVGQIVQALAPDVAFPRMKAGVSLMAHILISKYVDHLPLYRIIAQLMRHGIKIPDATVGEWVKVAANYLELLYQAYEKKIFDSFYLQIDETTLKVLEDGKGKCHLGYLWVLFDPVRKLPFFYYQTGRDHLIPKEKLRHFVGHLQCDGYTVYETLQKSLPRIQLVNCLAHIRRGFFDAQDNDHKRATTALNIIKELYKIEAEARDQQMTHEQRFHLRQEKAKPIFDEMGRWLLLEFQNVLPQSAIGKAIAYALRRWENMKRYLTDGKIEIDNNLVENVIRPVAIGRKNYLFAGSHEAAQRSAMLYTFFADCKHHDINPETWLLDVLNRMHKHPFKKIEELFPHNWKNSYA
jgi:transposase